MLNKTFLMLIIFFSIAFSVQADEIIEIEPVFDVWLDEDDPTVNYLYGSNFVKGGSWGNSRKTAIAFDTSSLVGKNISRAFLHLQKQVNPIKFTNVDLWSCVDAFTETANWNCAADTDQDGDCNGVGDLQWTEEHGQNILVANRTISPHHSIVDTWNITEYLRSNAGSIVRFILTAEKQNDVLVDFFSEWEQKPPKLKVYWTPMNCGTSLRIQIDERYHHIGDQQCYSCIMKNPEGTYWSKDFYLSE